ncbi:MAG: hypothetical protein C0503_06645 [Gemmatimonas sp.]|nr:hypothetical protein [Gemmatimonas sp.]
MAAVLTVAACDGPPAAEAALTPFERVLADSLAGDSAAFAALPPTLHEFLDVRTALGDATLERCDVMPSRHRHELRRRLRLVFDDSSRVLLYAVADDSTGRLDRVEYIRRIPLRGQRGLIWDGEKDRTTSTWWSETRWGLSRRVERGEIPRGGPVPRALRGLGRQLMLVACAETADSTTTSAP